MNLGIDAGTKFIKISSIDKNGTITSDIYSQHFGDPEKTIENLINKNKLNCIEKIIFTGSHAEQLSKLYKNAEIADEISSIIKALNYIGNNCKYIINVGSGSIKLINLNDRMEFSAYVENSLCAAGTGSFLDEQMHRMNFSYDDIKSMQFIMNAPDIATRCAVFAKSDLIHRQQEGYTKEEMWSGLCKGVTTTMLQSVFRGNIPYENILFCGGLFLNPIVRLWIKEMIKNPVFHDKGHLLSSIGSILLKNTKKPTFLNKPEKTDSDTRILELKYSIPADFSAKKEYISNGIEIRIHKDISTRSDFAIGIDIGSTSTKLVVLDSKTHDVLIDIYGKTKGNPVEATKKLFNELKNIFNTNKYNITNISTTGSGRKLIGKIIGADLITNEITAHFKGATYYYPDVETIFEIGGQDSKYIRGRKGNVVDCNMNFVCAAGTGSFIEEQAERLGFNIKDIGDIVLGLNSPHTSDRCTVFMEQDINKLLSQGLTREEVLSGVIRSIGKNYLNRVVGSRPISGNRIFFQGATARNKGLVAAFESFLQKEVIVSPYCHVMGALGAALLSLEEKSNNSHFRGLDVFDQDINIEYSKCRKCSNLCNITTAKLNNQISESWGFMCGKESFDEARKTLLTDYFNQKNFINTSFSSFPIKESVTDKIKIGIPNVLLMLNQLPLWKTFFEKLGFKVIISAKSSAETKNSGINISKADYCFPIKLSLAHFQEIEDKSDIDFIFYPAVLSEKSQENGMPRMLCPYVISCPSVAKGTLNITKQIISPSIDFRQKTAVIIDSLYESLINSNIHISRSNIANAYKAGLIELDLFFKDRFKTGKTILKNIENSKTPAIVCIGRPYNLYDKIVNLGLTERLKNYNMPVFPYEYLIDPDENNSKIDHMYWNYGEKILSAASRISEIKNLYPIYFSNFSCGPDSFILTRFEEIMQGKPYLIIELDEHGSETGYLTRIEAFIDVINKKAERKTLPTKPQKYFKKKWNRKEKKIWFPKMFEIAPGFFAAAFRAWGFDAEALDIENNESYELGRQNSRGSECLPAIATIGAFLKKLKEIDADPSKHALFMPTAEGPCRFGQYSMLHRHILDRNGFSESDIFSPTSSNSYMGMEGSLTRYLMDIVMSSDIISKFIHKTRPYEINSGETDRISGIILKNMEKKIESKGNLFNITSKAIEEISCIKTDSSNKPLVGIVGEIYVRSNPFCNNNVIRFIEENGGEAWLSPFSEWIIYTAWMENYFAHLHRKGPLKRLGVNIKTGYMLKKMHEFEHAMEKYIIGRTEPDIEEVLESGKKYMPLEFEGETIVTIGRTIKFLDNGASMVVNCAPFGCMPGNITTSIFNKIQNEYNKPIINLFYDGESDINRVIGIYLNNIKQQKTDTLINKRHLSLTNSNFSG